MLYHSLFYAIRRSMRRHQDLPHTSERLPMWRLLEGELLWGLRQLAANPWIVLGLAGSAIATFAVLSTAAPGPVLDIQWRMLVAIAAGLVISAGIRELQNILASHTHEPAAEDEHRRPLLGATIVSTTATALILLAWLVLWLIRLLA